MSPKQVPAAPADRVEAYDRLVVAVPEVERKGATMPYTSVNGNMFSFLDAAGSMAMRLSASDRAAFIERFATKLHEAYGIVHKEYVTVPDAVLDDTELLLPWFRSSYAYALTLKPKPSRRSPGTHRGRRSRLRCPPRYASGPTSALPPSA